MASYRDLTDALANAEQCTGLYLDLKEADAIPADVGRLTNLEDLYVTGKHQLPYAIPREIVALPKLRKLTPGGTYTEFPAEILAMPALEELKLDYTCKLRAFPDALADLKLRKLDLSGMTLGTIPDVICRMTELRELDLARCAIEAVPDALARLVNLEKLEIDGTHEASWGAPPALFALPRLRELHITNGLVGLPDDIARLTELEVLSLWTTQIDRIPDALTTLPTLRELALRDQQLTVVPDTIGDLAALEKLDLYRNEIRTLPAAIGRLSKLRELNLESNPLQSLPPEIGNLTSLTKLELQRTQLTTLPPEIGKLTALDVLGINYTATLASLPDSFGDLASLRCCWLRRNKLTRLPDTLGKLGKLEVLALTENQLSSMPASLGDCAALYELELTGNTFTADEITRLRGLVATIKKRTGRSFNLELPREAGPTIEVPATADPRALAPEVMTEIARLGGTLGELRPRAVEQLALGAWPLPMAIRQWRSIAFPPGSMFRGTIMKHYGAKTIDIPGGLEMQEYECSHHAPWDCIGYENTQTYLVVNLRDPVIQNPVVHRLDSHAYKDHAPLNTGLTLAQLLAKLRPVAGAEIRALLYGVWNTTGDARVAAAHSIATLSPKQLRAFEAKSRLVWLLDADEPDAVAAALRGLAKLGRDAADALPKIEALGTPAAAKTAAKIRKPRRATS